jgi:uncharacterized delta-60 repeat protein
MKTLVRCSLLAFLITGLLWMLRSRDESVTAAAPIHNVPEDAPVALSVPVPAAAVGSGWESETSPAMAGFAGWCSSYDAATDAERTALIAEGVRLARERRKELAGWIRTDPERALAAAVPEMQRRTLPAEIVALLEERVSGQGELARVGALPEPGETLAEPMFHKALVGGREFFAYPYGRRAILNTLPQASLSGIALDGHMAVSDSPMRALEPGETAGGRRVIADGMDIGADMPLNADPSAPPTAFEVNGDVVVFAEAAQAADMERQLISDENAGKELVAADNLPGTSGVAGRPAQAWTHGTKKLLVIRIDFSDLTGTPTNFFDGNTPIDENYAVNRINSTGGVKDFFEEGSFGKTSIDIAPTVAGDSPDVTGVLRMPQTASYYATNNFTSTMHSDAQAAAAAAGFTLNDYDRIGVVFSRLSALPGSQITFGGLGNIEGKNFWINSSYSFRTVTHELGHNYGLYHASHWTVTDGNPVSPTGASDEYGDIFDLMGDADTKEYHFSHWNKSLMQWIPDTSVATITTGGTYRVHRFDHQAANFANSLALKIVRTRDQDYWIGLRRATNNASMDGGAYVLWGYNENRESDLLDLTAPVNDLSSAALAVGATFVDSAAGITLNTVAQGGSGGADEWLDVQVTLQPRISWDLAGFVADEQGASATLTLIRESNSAGTVSVHYATSNGTATAPADYTASSGTVSWPDGDLTPKQITIPIVADALIEGSENFTVTLDTPTGGAVIVNDLAATVTIAEAGARDDTFTPNFVNSTAEKILLLPDGGALLGGWFGTIQGGYTRGGITRIGADGKLDPTFADEGGLGPFTGSKRVIDIARQPDGKIIVVGEFDSFHGQTHNRIVRLNTNGTLDSTFDVGTGANDTVNAVVIRPNGKILIGGRFTSFNGTAREYVVQLDENGTADSTFTGPNFGDTSGWRVQSLALLPDGKALIGGTFYFIGSPFKASLCRVNTTGSLDGTFSGVTNGAHMAGDITSIESVDVIEVEMSGNILIAGSFTAFNNTAREGFARLTSTGALDPAINPTMNGSCNAILIQPDGRIIVGGDFTTFNGVTVNHLARLSSSGVVETAFSAGGGFANTIDNLATVNSLALQPDGKVLVAGPNMYFQGSGDYSAYWRFFGGLPGLPGTMQIDTESVVGVEGTNASVSVSRTGGSSGTVSVGYSTVAGTAGAADFTTTSGTLTWADGDAAAKSITVPILADGVAESAESLFVQIGEPLRNSAILGEVQRATVGVTTAFDAWRIGQFTALELADSNVSGDLADPDLDGSKNLLEFALNMPPKTGSQSGLPTMGSTNVSGQDYLTITFLRRIPSLDLTYTAQTNGSLDSAGWMANAVQVGTPDNHGNGTETVTFRDSTPISGATKRFLRLMVTRSP